ncbi:transglutaminase-like domain-containing protein [Cellulomonas sp. URHB0016]
MPTIDAYAQHSRYSDPGIHAALLADIAPTPAALHQAACATLVHYRGQASELADGQVADVDLRWLADVLDVATARVPGPLATDRPVPDRVAGCCRDFTLLAVGALREHGIPARSRIGFAGYFEEGFHYDHVVAERWDGHRWVRFDAMLDPARGLRPGQRPGPQGWGFDVHDIPAGAGAPFQTAAEVWLQVRAGTVDASVFGVDPSLPELGGAEFVRQYVLMELAHRQRDELLLWDLWSAVPDDVWRAVPKDGPDDGPEGGPGQAPAGMPAAPGDDLDRVADRVAELLVRADAGDAGAEAALDEVYAAASLVNPNRAAVVTMSPTGRVGDTDLEARRTLWRS